MMNLTPTLQDCELLDTQDPLRALRGQFDLPAGVIYLDGNSLGVLPKTAPARVAQPGEVIAADSTSINLFKVLAAALHIAKADHPHKTKIVSERSNFPTDLYIAEALCKERGYTLQLVEAEDLAAALQDDVAVLMLTHVNYRTGAMHDMPAVTAAAGCPRAGLRRVRDGDRCA